MLKINYTKELVDGIKRVYPGNTLLHDLAEAGEESIGRILLDSIPKDPTYDEIINAVTFEAFLALQNRAKEAKIKDALYEKWIREAHAAYLNDIMSKPKEKRKMPYTLIEEEQ
jgi:hypothetical protein